jgi:alkylated DNA nucleotide flippase Atl1
VPWWRVIRAGGHPPLCHDEAALQFYRSENTPLIWSASGSFRVNLALARHRP